MFKAIFEGNTMKKAADLEILWKTGIQKLTFFDVL